MLADAKGYLYPANGRLPQGEPGMSVLDRINKLFIENPNYMPVGVSLPIHPVLDTPPRIAAPRQETMYQAQPTVQHSMYQGHLLPQESVYQTNDRALPPATYGTSSPNGPPPRIQESNYFEVITPDDPPDDDPCEGIALIFKQEESLEDSQECLAAATKRSAPREVFDGVEIVTRKAPSGSKSKWKEDNRKGRPPGHRPAPPTTPAAPQEESAADPKPQYRTTIPAYDDAAVSNVFGKILDSEVTLLIRSLFAASLEIRRKCKEFVTGC
ncbi:hypothetical protein ACEPAH_9525 [Sanghuangporus vaninii]